MNKETLGISQAFASIAVEKNQTFGSTGLTKREYFAAIALQGILSQHDSRPTYTATLAVEYADALIDALNK
jgi:hypothetical protein